MSSSVLRPRRSTPLSHHRLQRQCYISNMYNKKAVLPQGNRAMPQVFFSVEVRQQHSLQVYKTSHASKATLHSSKHAGAKHNLTRNQDSKSRVWSQWKSSEAISNHNVGFNCQGFDFRVSTTLVFKKDLHIFPWISNIQPITVLNSASRQSHALIYI